MLELFIVKWLLSIWYYFYEPAEELYPVRSYDSLVECQKHKLEGDVCTGSGNLFRPESKQ